MKREIKFRAWDKKEKLMCDVWGISFDSKTAYVVAFNTGVPLPAFGNRKFEDLEFLQYIGKKDKFKNELYEGDIVAIFQRGNETELAYKIVIEDIRDLSVNLEKGEKIGNIYEDFEMLS